MYYKQNIIYYSINKRTLESDNMNRTITSNYSQVYKKCPKCGKVNKHEWAKTIVLHSGFFVVKCECGKTYQQAMV